MEQIRSHARQAGLLYLALAIIAPFSLSYVPGVLAAAGGVSAATLAAHKTLLRLSMTSEMIYQVLEIYIVLALFALFRGVDRKLALQMLVLGLVPIPIVFLNELPGIGALMIATGQNAGQAMAPAALETAAVTLHELHQLGLVIASIFWGLWLFPLGRLIIASNFLPNMLGWSVIVGGLGYVVRAFMILGPEHWLPDSATKMTLSVSETMILGEVPVIVGLLWLGFRFTTRHSNSSHERA
jgi:Domain of unknown function (DUF4386)